MALEKVIKTDRVEVVGDFHHVQVRTATIIYDDGVELSSSFHRHVIAPGDDYSNEEDWVQAVCAAAHTPEIIEAYAAHLAAQASAVKEAEEAETEEPTDD